jgi:hypothetical protein
MGDCPECKQPEDEGLLKCSTCGLGPEVFAATRAIVDKLGDHAFHLGYAVKPGQLAEDPLEDEDEALALWVMGEVIRDYVAPIITERDAALAEANSLIVGARQERNSAHAHAARLERAIRRAHSLIDQAMGDTDPPDADAPLLRAAQELAQVLPALEAGKGPPARGECCERCGDSGWVEGEEFDGAPVADVPCPVCHRAGR